MKTNVTSLLKIASGPLIGASCAVLIAASGASAADTYAEYETQADLGKITQMPGKTKRKTGPRAVNHARYEVLAEKGIFIQPKRIKKTPAELAKRRNHAEYDVQYNDTDG